MSTACCSDRTCNNTQSLTCSGAHSALIAHVGVDTKLVSDGNGRYLKSTYRTYHKYHKSPAGPSARCFAMFPFLFPSSPTPRHTPHRRRGGGRRAPPHQHTYPHEPDLIRKAPEPGRPRLGLRRNMVHGEFSKPRSFCCLHVFPFPSPPAAPGEVEGLPPPTPPIHTHAWLCKKCHTPALPLEPGPGAEQLKARTSKEICVSRTTSRTAF